MNDALSGKTPDNRAGEEPAPTRRFELIDFDSFAKPAAANTPENRPGDASAGAGEAQGDTVNFSPSGRLIWTWETLDDTSQTPPEPEGQAAPEPEAQDVPEAEEQAAPEAAAADVPARPRASRQERKAREKAQRREAAPAAAYRYYTKAVKRTAGRVPIGALVCLLGAYITLAAVYGWWLPAFLEGIVRYVLSGLLVVQLLVCYDIPVRACYGLFHGRFGLEGMTLLTAGLCLADGLTSRAAAYPSYCAVPLLALVLVLWGSCQRSVALRRSVKVLSTAKAPVGVVSQDGCWEGLRCLYQAEHPTQGFILDLEEGDVNQTLLGLWLPIAALAALAVALVSTLKAGTGYLSNAAVLLCGALPAAGALSFARPFARLARSLQRKGAALGGWAGAAAAYRADAVILTDEDLFPPGAITHSGVKVYNGHTPAQALACARAVLNQEGGSLAALVDALARDLRAPEYVCGDYRAYEGGGLGGEVAGNIVLVGSLSFMRLMGTEMPVGTAVRQAVYISINGELAAVIALHYAAASSVRSALATLLGCRRLKTILATRNFLITPAFLKQLFGLGSDRFVYPSMKERMALCAAVGVKPEEAKPRLRVAIEADKTLSGLARAMVGGRQLYTLTRINTAFNLAGSALGLVLLGCLTFIGSAFALNPGSLLVYAAVWSVPPILLSNWAADK